MMTDPIADMLAQIRNAMLARLGQAEVPLSQIKERVADILKREGYIRDYEVSRNLPGRLKIYLKYGRDQESAIAGLRRRSRPGRREYVSYRELPEIHNGMGIAILSTSQGVMTDRDARTKRVGGELICEVW